MNCFRAFWRVGADEVVNPGAWTGKPHRRSSHSRPNTVILILVMIGMAMSAATVSAIPIVTVFTFPVPLLPGRDDKFSGEGGLRGWGGLFISFNVEVTKATFTIDPVLNACVNVDPFPIKADGKVGALPADSFLWKCNSGYQLDAFVHPGLTVKVTVESDLPVSLLVDRLDAADPMNTFWWQKSTINDDGTITFGRNRDSTAPIKLAARVPEPAPMPLMLGAIGVLCSFLWRRKDQLTG